MKKIFILIAIFLLIACNKTDDKQVGENSFENKTPPLGNINSQQLNKIMTIDTLGVQKEYFEKNYGPAKRIFGNIQNYEIGPCSVNIEYDKKDSVASIELNNISQECNFRGGNINLTSMADKITYDELIKTAIDWNAKLSCYSMCGNAADPEYGAFFQASRAGGSIEYDAISNYTLAGDASNNVEDYFKKKYPDIDLVGDDLGIIPKDEYNKIWIENFKNVNLTAIKFGYNLKK
jgi:hypothetical protein